MEIMCEEPGEDRGRKEGVANENKERERGRDLCIVKPAAIHKWDPWQNKLKPNNPQLTLSLRIGNNPVPHTHTNCMQIHIHTKPSIRSKTNSLTQFLSIGFCR